MVKQRRTPNPTALRQRSRALALLLCTLLVPGPACAELITDALVVSVHDGDTLRARTRQGDMLTIRIAGIDAPELGQPFGRESRVLLAAAIAEDPVDLDCFSTDRYFRRICRIRSRGRDIALEQVMSGAAWWYRAYARDQTIQEASRYSAAERDAKAAKAGLWSSDPMPPWEWRRRQRH